MRRPLPAGFSEPLRDARALEIGGPSGCFQADGVIALYPILESIDGVQPMASSTWHELDPAAGNIIEGRRRGELLITDDIELRDLPDAAYGLVMSSHVIEHIANPLRALAAWRRISVPNGHMMLVAPHMAGTFDHRRPLTPLSHMIADFEQSTQEDDLTHLGEFLEHHDAARNVRGQDDPAFVAALKDNLHTRLLHHHTFTTHSLFALLNYARVQIIAAEARLPHDIYVLGRWLAEGQLPDNRRYLERRIRSPFRVDRTVQSR